MTHVTISLRTVSKARLRVSAADGLHARPAAMLVKLAKNFDAEIEIALDGKKVNAKSIMGILALGAEYGAEVVVSAEGSDAAAAVEAVERLFACSFHEQPGPAERAATIRVPRGMAPEGKGELNGHPKGNIALAHNEIVPDPGNKLVRIAVECCGRGAIRASMDSFADLGAVREDGSLGKAAYREDLGQSRRQQANA